MVRRPVRSGHTGGLHRSAAGCAVTAAQQGGGELPQDERAALVYLCDWLDKLPRRQIKDSQTHSYVAADNVEALVEQARAALAQRAAQVAELPRTPSRLILQRAMFAAYSECLTSTDMLPQHIADKLLAAAQRAASVPAQAGQPVAEVLPCPFCGSAAHVDYDRMGLATYGRVRCVAMDCRADVYSQEGKDAAIAMWNRRAAPAPAASVQPTAPASFDSWYHRKTHMSREHAQIAFDAGAASVQPDIGRDAALVDRIELLHGAYITRETKTTGANGWLLRNEHGLVRALDVFETEFVDCALAAQATQAAPEVAHVPNTQPTGLLTAIDQCGGVNGFAQRLGVPHTVVCGWLIGEKQLVEPAAWVVSCYGELTGNIYLDKVRTQNLMERLNREYPDDEAKRELLPLYTCPQPAPAVLTDEQIVQAVDRANVKCVHPSAQTTIDIARAVLAAAGK